MNILSEKNIQSRDHFESELPNRLDELDDKWHDLLVIEWREEKLKEIQQLSQTLAEISGRFGYAQISKAARKLDEMCHSLLLNQDISVSEQKSLLSSLIQRLHDNAVADEAGSS